MDDKLNQDDIHKMIPLIQEINHSIDTLLSLAMAWSEKDFETATHKLDQSFQHLQDAKAVAAQCEDEVQRSHYLQELNDVEELLGSFEAFIHSRVGRFSQHTESSLPSNN